MPKGLSKDALVTIPAMKLASLFRELEGERGIQDVVDAHLFALGTLVTNSAPEIHALLGDRADRRQYLSERLDNIIGQLLAAAPQGTSNEDETTH